MKRSARMAAFLLAAALSAAPCLAEFTPVEVPQATNTSAAPEAMENVPQITEKGLTLGNNSVKYPEITGMADESIQQQVNDAILQAGKIENRLSRMAVLMSSPVPLTVTYSAALADDVLSVAILSSGALETERATQEWAAVNIDLRTGQEITFDDLFTDADEARAKMEETIADEILPDMSAPLAAAELLPLPAVFSLTEYGLTLHYPIRRFETLSERAGTITFLWSELADMLDLSEDSVLTRLGVGKHLMLAADAKETLTAALSAGAFPSIPAARQCAGADRHLSAAERPGFGGRSADDFAGGRRFPQCVHPDGQSDAEAGQQRRAEHPGGQADAVRSGDGQHDAGRMAAGTGRTDADSIGIRGIRGTAALMRGADGLLCVVEQCNAVPARG